MSSSQARSAVVDDPVMSAPLLANNIKIMKIEEEGERLMYVAH
jgi:hypothetical protein